MTEILTESFCERCGTRYTFEAARPRVRLKGVKVLSRGLKNFVLSDETSMDEAMAAARSETDRELTAHQLDAFHKTFNFCMSCRQYTCPNCWNEVEARCLSCAPHLGHEILPAPFPDMAPTGFLVPDGHDANGANGSNGSGHPIELVGVAEIEAVRHAEDVDAAARLAALTAAAVEPSPQAEVVAEPEAVSEVVAEPEAEVVAEPEAVSEVVAEPEAVSEVVAEPEAVVVAEPEAVVVAEPEAVAEQEDASHLAAIAAAALVVDAVTPDEATSAPSIQDKAASQTTGLFHRFRPGQNLDAELEAYEREEAAGAPAGAESPVEEAFAEPDVASTGATPVVDDVVAQPVWQMVAPDPGAEAPLRPTVPPTTPTAPSAGTPSAEPQWPARPQWPATPPAAGLPFLGRPTAPQGGLEALWAESSREVVTTPSNPGRAVGVVQPCVSCGLSLSATAKFCRRCGTPQGG